MFSQYSCGVLSRRFSSRHSSTQSIDLFHSRGGLYCICVEWVVTMHCNCRVRAEHHARRLDFRVSWPWVFLVHFSVRVTELNQELYWGVLQNAKKVLLLRKQKNAPTLAVRNSLLMLRTGFTYFRASKMVSILLCGSLRFANMEGGVQLQHSLHWYCL